MTEEEMDRLMDYADTSYRLATNGDNIGLVAWTARVTTALKFIPTLAAIITQLRGDLKLSRLKEGGHLETIIGLKETRTTCSTCGTVVAAKPTTNAGL